jgi:hypothetical protein
MKVADLRDWRSDSRALVNNVYGYELKPYNKCLIQGNNPNNGFYL